MNEPWGIVISPTFGRVGCAFLGSDPGDHPSLKGLIELSVSQTDEGKRAFAECAQGLHLVPILTPAEAPVWTRIASRADVESRVVSPRIG